MQTYKLKDFRDWFCGAFEGAIFASKDFEVSIKRLQAGYTEKSHYHKLTSEITVVISGQVKMNGIEYGPDDIIVMEPNEVTDFECLTDTITCAVRNGSFPGDKYEKVS